MNLFRCLSFTHKLPLSSMPVKNDEPSSRAAFLSLWQIPFSHFRKLSRKLFTFALAQAMQAVAVPKWEAWSVRRDDEWDADKFHAILPSERCKGPSEATRKIHFLLPTKREKKSRTVIHHSLSVAERRTFLIKHSPTSLPSRPKLLFLGWFSISC